MFKVFEILDFLRKLHDAVSRLGYYAALGW